VRELSPNTVSIDFQRRDLLRDVVPAPELVEQVAAAKGLDLGRVWSGRTEYGRDWYQPLLGGHTIYIGATGSGKNAYTWTPLVVLAPYIRDGLVRVSGIDPKGMELAYGRGVFSRYAVTPTGALEVLDALVEELETRKKAYAGKVRAVDITAECPLELVEFDEVAALTKYTGDRKTREAIIDRVSVLNTQGRALGFCVRGYVQTPNKDTVPIRDLFPRRVCLRVPTKAHVAMALGDNAWDRGAWANRIGESEAGVGYLFGEGVREPLRVRSAWITDPQIKALEAFVTGGLVPAGAGHGQLLSLPTRVNQPAGGVA
jgi:S-DNA-T family DNA segregation ATPase FtsK/SpoIIIE